MKQTIQTESYVVQENEPHPVSLLPEEERQALARWLRMTWLTELSRGRAEVTWAQKKDPVK